MAHALAHVTPLPESRDEGWQPTAKLLEELDAYEPPELLAQIVDHGHSPAEAERIFAELKRYLALTAIARPTPLPAFSRAVDEAWRALAMRPRFYAWFCARFFGGYLPRDVDRGPFSRVSFDAFAALYIAVFGETPPRLWRDEDDEPTDVSAWRR